MPYVPGFGSDIFVSYASEDSTWVAEFQHKLDEAMVELGLEAEVWRDKQNIRFGQNWKEEMFKAVEQSALFLAILSPNYRQSDYCNDESDYFQELREKSNDMKVGLQNLHRYLKIIKQPWPNGAHRGLLPELQDIEFFKPDDQAKIDLPLAFSSKEFETRIRLAASGIDATLKAMRRLRELVYVASPADDVAAEWKEIRAELGQQGYVVGPAGKLNRGLSADFIKDEFKGAVLTIHLLGSAYHPLAERQLDLCAESGQKMAVWIRKGADENAEPEQRKLLAAVRNFEKIPKGTPLIEGATGRAPLTDLLELLKAKRSDTHAADARTAGKRMVYLICDPTVDEDRNFALQLERSMEDREKLEVVLPQRDATSAYERHRQALRDCDGVLLFREKAPEPWFFQYLSDVARAERLLKRPPLLSKAILADENDLTDLAAPTSVKLIGRANPFTLDSLEPFLAPLRAGNAGVAYAGN